MKRWMILLLAAGVGAGSGLTAGTAYYYDENPQAGVIGVEANAEKALFAQFGGTRQPVSDRILPAFAAIGETAQLVWKFERTAGDTAPYAVTLNVEGYAEPGSGLEPVLYVGYDEFAGEQRTDRYFVTNDTARVRIAESEVKDQKFHLGNDRQLVVPPELREFYVVVETPTPASGGLAGRVESLTVRFEALPPPLLAEVVECSYWAASRDLDWNVVELGADPTGNRDSSPAFQQALDAGGLIRIPPGRYRVDTTLVIRKSHTYLVGEGLPELFRERNEGDYSILVNAMVPGVRQMQDIRIENIAFTVPDWRIPHLDNPSAAIIANGIRQLEISNCVTRFPAHEGIRVFCGERVRVSNCTTYGSRHGISVGGNYRGYGAFDTQFVDNQIYYAWDTGIVVGILTHRTLVSGNLLEAIGCHAMDIFNCTDVVVTGNLIRNWLDPKVNFYDFGDFRQAVGIFVHTDWGLDQVRTIPTRNVTVSGNTLVCDYDYELLPGQQGSANPVAAEIYYSPIGIQVTGDLVRNVTVTGNTVTGGAKGFYLSSLAPFGELVQSAVLDGTPQNVTCVGNTFSGQKYSAIEVDSRVVPIRARIGGNLLADPPQPAVRVTPESHVTVEAGPEQ